MRERFKTILLVSLVGLSLFLTKNIWIELPFKSFTDLTKTDKAYSSSYLLSDMIMPNRYLLNFDDKYHAIFYDDTKYGLWAKTRKNMANILGSKDVKVEEISKEDLLVYEKKPSINFYFPEKANTYLLARALDVKDPSFIVDMIANVDSIFVYLGKEGSFFVFSGDNKNLALRENNLDLGDLRNLFHEIESEKNYNYYYSSKDTYGTERDIFLPYEMKNSIQTVYVENEIRGFDIEKKRELAEKFLNKSIDDIREIVEDNESTIYEYNHKVLKLNVNGLIEYFNPLEEPVRRRNLYKSLNAAAEFITQTAGITKGMYLTKAEPIEDGNDVGYNLLFRYRIKGIPVILGNEEVEDFIQIQVFNDHVRTYKYYVRKEMARSLSIIPENQTMLTSIDIIDINYDYILDELIDKGLLVSDNRLDVTINQVLSSMEDITLSYFDPCLKDIGDELIPVWVIRTEKNLYAFDVYHGFLVHEKIRR